MHYRHAFSLVELSIVLVILGLLTGGILSGQSLIRAAELRSITTGIQQYKTSSMTFRDRYVGLAGDIRNATSFWGFDNTASGCSNNTSAANNGTNGVCDGNGDGRLHGSEDAASGTREEFQFWKQLAKAGLIEGTYTGISNTTDGLTAGENVPQARLSNARWRIFFMGDRSGTVTGSPVSSFAVDYGNGLVLEGSSGARILRPEEVWNIDSKIDDGRPAQGNIIARPWNSNCTTASARTDLSAEYALDQTGTNCIVINRQF